MGLLHPAQGLAYAWLDLPVSLLGWCLLAALLAAPRQGERLAAAVLLAVAAPALLGSPLWALLAVPAALLPKPGLVGFAALGLLSGLLHPRQEPAPARNPELPGLVLITVDTLRYDHGALLLEETPIQALSAAPWTLPAMDSLMLGQDALAHGGGRLDGDAFTRPLGAPLAERLRERGYVSSAWVCNPHLREEMGFDAGFESFVHSDHWRDPVLLRGLIDERVHQLGGPPPRLWRARDEALIALAQADLAQGLGGRFVWLHILGPHEYLRDPALPGERDPAQLYAGATRRAAAQLEALLSGLPDHARLLLISDHGESLGEGGEWGHGTALVDEQLLVPAFTRGWAERPAGLVPAWSLPGAVFLDEALPNMDEIPVAGVRRHPELAALRGEQGYRPISARETKGLPRVDGAAWRQQLQALGYEDAERDSSGPSKAEP